MPYGPRSLLNSMEACEQQHDGGQVDFNKGICAQEPEAHSEEDDSSQQEQVQPHDQAHARRRSVVLLAVPAASHIWLNEL